MCPCPSNVNKFQFLNSKKIHNLIFGKMSWCHSSIFLRDSKHDEMAAQEFLDAHQKKVYEAAESDNDKLNQGEYYDEKNVTDNLEAKDPVLFCPEARDLSIFFLRKWVKEKNDENDEPIIDRESPVEDQPPDEFVWYILEKDEVDPFLSLDCIKALFKIQFPEFCNNNHAYKWHPWIESWRDARLTPAKIAKAQNAVKRKRKEDDEQRSVRQKTSDEDPGEIADVVDKKE